MNRPIGRQMRCLMLTAALAGAAVSACAPHPIVARDPVPPPARGEAYSCSSSPVILNFFYSGCEPQIRERRTVLDSRG